ncbi:outer membrane beta-barrel protein [Marinomonas posidonica]|uniref:outer membrane beta-barrel protein n=1 Tax=Marinomonas posidonica TaxID=936476 RepID=UPI003734CDE1
MKKVLVSLLAVSGASMAAAVEKPFTAEVLLGNTDQSISFNNIDDASDSSLAIRFGYEFLDTWSAEVAYYDYGEASSNFIDSDNDTGQDTRSVSSFSVGIKKEIELNEKLSLNARLGLMFWDLDFERGYDVQSVDDLYNYKSSDSGNNLYYGASLGYSIKENLLLSVDYSFVSMEVDLKNNPTVDNDMSTLSIGLGYQF